MLSEPRARRSPGVGRPGGRPRREGSDLRSVLRATVSGLLLAAVISAVLLIDFLPSQQVLLNEGDVSPRDILAPQDLTYNSAIKTVLAQDAQARAVQDVYDAPDPSVARDQETRAQQVLEYISTVRQDPYASPEDRVRWIASIADLDLPPEIIVRILALEDDRWQEVRDEVIRVLALAMQGEIREAQLSDIRRRLPTLISPDLTDGQTQIVNAVVGGLVKANTRLNATRTEEARQQARDNTAPVTVTIRRGEAIVRAGDRVNALSIEALDVFGLRQQATRWQSALGTILFALTAVTLLEILIVRLQPDLWRRRRAALVVSLLVAFFVILGKLMIPMSDTVVPYLYPLPALSMILTILFGPALGMAVGVAVGCVGAFVAGGSLEITIYLLASVLIGALVLGRAERLSVFLRAGLSVAVTNAAVIVLFGLLAADADMLKVAIDALAGIVMGGLAASLALVSFLALSALLGVITPFQLMELARPTHPLFRQLLLKAPGTYHHTLLVSNMAEEAANRIGADGLLVRVGSYYHDIGKTARPYFFSENRVGEVDPHERLDPHTSAQLVISHVQDGLDLAEKYRLPSAIRAFIPEHQGTGLTLSFYRSAVSTAGDNGQGIHEEDFRYPGPRPQSKETAIVMLADSCEARVRSMKPASAEEMAGIVHETIKYKLDSGELDESDLTLRDLETIREAFLDVLQGVFHPRVQYPEPVKVKGPNGHDVIR